mgnify:CR=1 FL=1
MSVATDRRTDDLRGRHLLGIDGMDRSDLEEILDLTDTFAEIGRRPIPKVPALRGRTVATVFFEGSTRTRMSFEAAARRLSADTVAFNAGTSSLSKGESIRDTVEVVASYGADLLVVRHSMAGTAHRVAGWTDLSVVNAGDGCHEHPTQALLDCYTLRERRGSLDGMRIAIVGDILHPIRAPNARRVLRIGRPERRLVDPIALALDLFGETEGLEHLHRASVDAVGLALGDVTRVALDNHRLDLGELRQLRRKAQPCRACAGDQHVDLFGQRRMRAVFSAARRRILEVRVTPSKTVHIELHRRSSLSSGQRAAGCVRH